MRPPLEGAAALCVLALLGCGGGSSSVAPVSGTAPASAFTFSPAAPTPGETVSFTDGSTQTPTSWSWNFGDGAASTAQNPSHAFAAAGTYTVSLTSSNAAGSGTASRTVSVAAAATGAAFSYTPSNPVSGQAVTFTDGSAGSPTAWSWSFGDGAVSTERNPTHTFTAAANWTFPVTLAATTASGTRTAQQAVTVLPAALAAAASFGFAPLAPVPGQAVTFTDTSGGSPSAWAWTFGDGTTSTARNPAHAFAAAGAYPVALTVTLASGALATSRSLTVVPAAAATAFGGSVILGAPTGTSIKANVFAPDQGGTVYLGYGTASGASYPQQTTAASLAPGTPLELSITGLSPDTAYHYRLFFKAAGAADYAAGPECAFHTARAAGSTFTFCLQGDSHPERVNTQFNAALYNLTLQTAAADRPDFYLLMGDDFSIDQINQANPAAVTADQVAGRYLLQRPYLGVIGSGAPVFLVNGNHEQAARYLLDGTAANPAVWGQNARNSFYSQPAPDGFYSGNPEVVPFIGLLRNYYAWTWGDALFVTLDPYWGSPTCVDNPFYGGTKRSSLWDVTHGDAQFQWLKATLAASTATYKFVFAHHVMGTGRGGVELAPLYEWGGLDGNGTFAFTAKRPGWSEPIHQLFVDNHVTVFFQGHDHIWVHQTLDGVVYQTLSEPADPNYSLFNADAYLTGDAFPNSGYTRVTVAPAGVKVEYVRTYLPADQTASRVNGSVAFSYSLP